MKTLKLYNPQNIKGILTKKQYFELEDGWFFQEYPKQIEVWFKMEDGRLFLHKRFNKTSITHACYEKSFELLREYIKP